MKKLILIFAAVVLICCITGAASAQDIPALPEPDALLEMENPEEVRFQGRIEGTGSHFEITDSEYLTVTLDSSEEISLTMESVTEMVTLEIASSAGASSSQITLSGFEPLTTYYMYEDNYHNLTIVTTDESGSYTYAQDLSVSHIVFIQPRKSTKFISDDATGGDCASIGTWVSATKTCTLTTDLTETIQIDSDGITLDGNGHTLTGSNTGNGVYLNSTTGVTVRNMNITGFARGIEIWRSNGNTIAGSTFSGNYYGINIRSSDGNTVAGNDASGNRYDGITLYGSDANSLTGNSASNRRRYGIYLSGSSNNTITGNTASNNDSSYNNEYGIVLDNSFGNTLADNVAKENKFYDLYIFGNQDIHCDNTITNTTGSGDRPVKYFNSAVSIQNEVLSLLILCNADGSNIDGVTIEGSESLKNNELLVFRTDNSTFTNIHSSDNRNGIHLDTSSGNTLTNNDTTNNRFYGIKLFDSNGNDLTDNTVSSNDREGILLGTSNSNTFTSNTVMNNTSYGIGLSVSNGNILTGNTISDNSTGVYLTKSADNNLTGNTISYNRNGISFLSFNTASGNIVTDNNVSYNTSYGIITQGTGGITLTGNNVSNNGYCGISLHVSIDNTLINNTVSNNGYYGLFMSWSSNNIIRDSFAKENGYHDLYISPQSDPSFCNHTVENITGSGDRPIKYFNTPVNLQNEILSELILCDADGSTINNVMIDGSATKNNNGILVNITENTSFANINSSNNYYGIYLSGSSNNTMTGSTASNNVHGIYLDSSSDNLVYNNNFISNSSQARVTSGSGNVFNLPSPTGGNYWSNWTTPDADGDGFVDIPYNFSGGVDNLPLTDQYSLNEPPVANAGVNIQITSADQAYTVVQGTATDPDGDALQYRWLEGSEVLLDWSPVDVTGGAYLDLALLPYLAIGNHSLTLEVTDGTEMAADDVLLTIDNSPPEVQPAPSSQVVEINIDPITIIADVSDFDGDTVTYECLKGTEVLDSGTVETVQGGTTVQIPDVVVEAGDPRFPLGTHMLEMTVSDSVNPPVSAFVSVNVIDTTAPSLSPLPNITMLWPPNHKLVQVTMLANAFDNGGGTIHLDMTVVSSEPPDMDGDGNTIPDYYIDSVNNETGLIELRLRSERSGKGEGRTYTINITATDESGNQSSAHVEVRAPHDKRKK